MGLQFSQLNVAAPSELQYFNLTSPVILPIILTLEIGAIDYTPTKIEFSDWGTIKATTPTGMLPVAKLSDGTTIVESSAIARGAACAAGTLGSGAGFLTSEMLLGLTGDLNKKVMAGVPTLMTVGTWTPEQTAKAKTEILPDVLAHLAKYTQFMLPAGDRFTEGGLTIGEIDLFAKIYCMKVAFPEMVTPALKPFFERVLATPAVAKFFAGETKWGSMAFYVVAFP